MWLLAEHQVIFHNDEIVTILYEHGLELIQRICVDQPKTLEKWFNKRFPNTDREKRVILFCVRGRNLERVEDILLKRFGNHFSIYPLPNSQISSTEEVCSTPSGSEARINPAPIHWNSAIPK
jgi:hypothetical protein